LRYLNPDKGGKMAEHTVAKLFINKSPIEMNDFVESYFALISIAIVKSLKGVDYIKKVELQQDKGEVTVKVNGDVIDITPFPNDIICNTLTGMLVPLKGFDKVEQIDIIVEMK
jgi:hypothetical protein